MIPCHQAALLDNAVMRQLCRNTLKELRALLADINEDCDRTDLATEVLSIKEMADEHIGNSINRIEGEMQRIGVTT